MQHDLNTSHVTCGQTMLRGLLFALLANCWTVYKLAYAGSQAASSSMLCSRHVCDERLHISCHMLVVWHHAVRNRLKLPANCWGLRRRSYTKSEAYNFVLSRSPEY